MGKDVLEKEMLQCLRVDALIRLKDYSGFFESDKLRIVALLDVARNCELQVNHVVGKTDVIFTVSNLNTFSSSPTDVRNGYQPFYREVIRVGLLLEKLVLLIDPKAKIEVDYPSKELLVGLSLHNSDSFRQEFVKNNREIKLSTAIPEQLNERIDTFLDLVIPPQNCMMGTCHWIWGMKKSIFRYGFGIDWKSPSELYPDVIFD